MLASTKIIPRVACWAAQPVVTRRVPLSTSSILSHKESSSHLDNDIDRHKLDSLRKQQSGSGHWKRELASDSEEAVKADRQHQQQHGAKESIETLQERTKRAAEEAKHGGTSHREGM